MDSAVIMHGPAGTGKSSIWKVYREIYGDGFIYFPLRFASLRLRHQPAGAGG
ncbi:MAG: hypothetical protein BECKG1743D_GA0114223_101337 [Candidatus Kentron sp. G]|nr:MAG: hypothetical protein BECKG1743F_GA0114225_101093 [Candidatus Kentron sp. G]VFM97167.1 MAG: hypothetical protein BECKG1743E_GA0114224_101167 [Candidatus Kentron sp. G]VFM99597.1 MAG: hypothetical protein BECKG1743D_GA0114223_101337 [Candidatus Kentron sp. G]